ncbi:Protein of uncharacterised function (DUF1602) [Mycobacteroides abscessus]|nr:Protein of uncharacterised function (DUF1602) [Mycobacteroides abscessus]
MTRRRSASTSRVVSGSSAEVASSARRIVGCAASARAIPTRCFCPPESWRGYAFALSASPTNARSSATRAARFSRDQPATLSG